MKKKNEWKTQIDEESFKKYKNTFDELTGWGEVIQGMRNANDALLDSEVAYRAKKKAEILKIPGMNEYYEGIEELHNNQGIKHLKQVLKLIDKKIEKIDPKKMQELDKVTTKLDEFQVSKNEALDVAKRGLMDYDLKPEEAAEIIQLFENAFETVEKKGATGLINELKMNLNELIELRSDLKKNRGRVHKSPLFWWKICLIASLLHLAVWAVLHCFTWQGCAFIISLIITHYPWLLPTIFFGC